MATATFQICILLWQSLEGHQANSSARFMEGGDLHGIVSIKVLDVSKKNQVEAAYVVTPIPSTGQPPIPDDDFIVSKVP